MSNSPEQPAVDPLGGDRTARRASSTLGHRRVHLGVVVGAYVVSRVAFWIGGVQFRDARIGRVHLADVSALRHDPFGVFTSLHIQPPLFNFFVGAVLRWSPAPPTVTFQVVYVAMGLTTAVLLWLLFDDLASRRWIATVAVILVAWNPLFVRNESVLTYEMPVTLLLTATAWCAHRYFERPDPGRLGALLAVLVAGVLTRAALNPLWFVGAIVVVLVLCRPRGGRRVVSVVVAAGVVAVAVPIAHDALRFHTIGLSSYSGMNLERITVMQLPQHRLDELIRRGDLSEAAAVVPFSDYDEYAPFFPRCDPPDGDLFLGPVEKANHGGANLNSVCYLPVYDQARRDAFAALRNDPGTYLRSVGIASMIYTTWGVHFAAPRSSLWNTWVDVYTPMMLPVSLHYPFDDSDPQPFTAQLADLAQVESVSITVVLALGVVIGGGVLAAWRLIRRRGDRSARTRVFIAFMVVGLTLVSVTLDIFENARFREPLDPLVLGLFAMALLEGVIRIRARVRDRVHVGPAPRESTGNIDGSTPAENAPCHE